MKVLFTLMFLAAAFSTIFFGKKLQIDVTKQILNRKISTLKTSLLSIIILILFFAEYSILTQQKFPFYIVLILIGALVIASIINEILTSVLGVSTKATKHKVNVMYVAMSFEQGLNQPSKYFVMIFASLFLFAGWIGALIVFWSNPIGNPGIYVWIAIFLFITPQLTNIVNTLNIISPMIASDYIDDDLRNSNLSGYFSSIIYSTIFFIFPFFLLSVEFSNRFTWLPQFWFLLCIPLIIFIFTGLIPFFIGAYKFRNQKENYLEWQINWLKEFKKAVEFSNESKKNEKINELKEEINLQSSENKMYAFLKELEFTPENEFADNKQKEVFLILKNNIKNLRQWDLQLWYINQLEYFKEEIGNKVDAEKLKEFVDGEIENNNDTISQLNKNKNKVVGITTSLFIGLIGFLLKTFQPDIVSFLGRSK